MATSEESRDYVVDVLSDIGEIHARNMMREYLVYFQGKLIGGIYDGKLLLKRTETSDAMLSDFELKYPYEGSRTLMYVVEDPAEIEERAVLLQGMYKDLPAPKPKKKK